MASGIHDDNPTVCPISFCGHQCPLWPYFVRSIIPRIDLFLLSDHNRCVDFNGVSSSDGNACVYVQASKTNCAADCVSYEIRPSNSVFATVDFMVWHRGNNENILFISCNICLSLHHTIMEAAHITQCAKFFAEHPETAADIMGWKIIKDEEGN